MSQPTVPVSVRVSYPQGLGIDEDKKVNLTLIDKVSGVEFASVYLSFENWGKLFSNTSVPAEAELFLDKVGWISENKTEEVIVPDVQTHSWDKRELTEFLKPYEVDGWTARQGDLGNWHRRTKNGYNVVFFRWVKPTEEQLQAEYAKCRKETW